MPEATPGFSMGAGPAVASARSTGFVFLLAVAGGLAGAWLTTGAAGGAAGVAATRGCRT